MTLEGQWCICTRLPSGVLFITWVSERSLLSEGGGGSKKRTNSEEGPLHTTSLQDGSVGRGVEDG